jgi:hypothetical protein
VIGDLRPLRDLLERLFTMKDLVIFLGEYEAGRYRTRFPEFADSRKQLVSLAVDVLERIGLIDKNLFLQLVAEFPQKRVEIVEVAAKVLGNDWDAMVEKRDPVTVLFIAGDRGGTQRNQIQIPREFDAIKAALRGCKHRDALILVNPILAATREKLTAAYRDRPSILHFAGHGDERSLSLILDQGLLVSHTLLVAEQLATILASFPHRSCLCVLNTCDSEPVAKHLVDARVVSAAVGWPAKLTDEAAVAFSATLYRCLGDGLTLSQSVSLASQSCSSAANPGLYMAEGVNPNIPIFPVRTE